MSSPKIVKKKDVFTEVFIGSYGRFKTNKSFRIDYLMTSIHSNDMDALSTASDVFPIEEVNFNTLIQRSIDRRRVQKIASEYLEHGEKRVIFFPPLLACVVLLDGDNIKEKYDEVSSEKKSDGEEKFVSVIWDNDGFKFEVPIGDPSTTDRSAILNGEKFYYYEYAASVKLNPARAKLIVLDGQHRLEALKLLSQNRAKKDVISDIEIPVCIVWAPDTTIDSSESMSENFRELFVRVNHEAKIVSGHFIILLKDNSFSADAIRGLADKWKSENEPGGWNRLHLLEWNEREDNKIDQRTRSFSVTTISIISRFLEEYVFNKRRASKFLNLASRSVELESVNPEISWKDILDSKIDQEFDVIVKEQIDKLLVPSLSDLFRKPEPYTDLENRLGKAFEMLQEKVDNNNSAFVSLNNSYLGKYVYKKAEFLDGVTLGAYEEFQGWVKVPDENRVFFYQVFQQAMLRFWSDLCNLLLDFNSEISLGSATKCVLHALNSMIFTKKEFLLSGNRYTNRVLWRNDNILQGSQNARNNWRNALVLTLCHEVVRANLMDSLESEGLIKDRDSLDEIVYNFGIGALLDYVRALRQELFKETEKNFSDYFEDEDLVQRLTLLSRSGNKEDKKKFRDAIEEKVRSRFNYALDELSGKLSVPIADILDF